jgi:hypothetical protein
MEHERSSFESQINHVVDDLATEFRMPKEAVKPVVSESFRSLSEARIKSYVPILARRFARSRLRQARGAA